MSSDSGSSRRDFLTGRSLRDKVEQTAREVGDALLDQAGRPIPRSFETVRLETRAMACTWAAVMNPGPPRQVMSASDALDIVHELEQALTIYREEGGVTVLNRSTPGEPVEVPRSLFDCLRLCADLTRETEGAFDVTGGILVGLWRAARQEGRVPTEDEIGEAMQRVGMEHVTLDEQVERCTVRLDREGMLLDLGGIGKGFAVDAVAEHLAAEQMDSFLVHGGYSTVLARGDHYGQGGWPVGLRNPLFTEQRFATVMLRDQALSSSGSNIQYFRHGGKRYGHILDPRTGQPAGGLLSVTVVAPSAATADALSTAFYVMGLEQARAYCESHREIGAVIVPSPTGRAIAPVVCNLPEESVFFMDEETGSRPSAAPFPSA